MKKKKTILSIIAITIMLAGTLIFQNKENSENINAAKQEKSSINYNEIHYFYQTNCFYCKLAVEYINSNIPNTKMKMVNINNKENIDLFLRFAKKHNLDKNNLGTPFISVGENYIMGWDDESGDNLKEYIKILEEKN